MTSKGKNKIKSGFLPIKYDLKVKGQDSIKDAAV